MAFVQVLLHNLDFVRTSRKFILRGAADQLQEIMRRGLGYVPNKSDQKNYSVRNLTEHSHVSFRKVPDKK